MNILIASKDLMMKRTILFFISLSLLGCSAQGPSRNEITKALEAELPGYFDVNQIDVEETENLGTKTEPIFKTRFKSEVQAKQDTFIPENASPSFSFVRTKPKVTYLVPKLKQGETEDIYGVASASRYRDKWNISFNFDNPPSQYGQPKNFFEGQAFVKGSNEEKEYNKKVEEQKKADKLATLNRFFNGEFQGTMTGAFFARPIIKFTSASVDNNKVEGQLIFRGGIIKGFSGSFNEEELTFKVDRLIQGEDKTGVGTNYTLRISDLGPDTRRIEGTYKHVDNRTGNIAFSL